jgi:hypothetical protein
MPILEYRARILILLVRRLVCDALSKGPIICLIVSDNFLIDENIPYNMKSAIYSGLTSSNISLPDPLFSCPTGNCTWEPFSTLGVSSRCVNLTSQVTLNCTTIPANENFHADTTEWCSFASPTLYPDATPTTLMIINSSAPAFASATIARVDWIKALDNIINYPYTVLNPSYIADTPSEPSAQPYIAPNTTFE